MKRFFILLIIIVNSLYVNANYYTTVLFAGSNTTTLHNDSLNTNVLLKSNVDTTGLTRHVLKEKSHSVSKNTTSLNKKTSSLVKRNSSLEKIKTKASNALKNQDTASYNSAQDFNVFVSSIDSLKHTIESMRQTNDSIQTVLSEFANKSENTFNLYSTISLILSIVFIIFIIISIKKYREIIKYKVEWQTDVTNKLQNSISLIKENISESIGNFQNCTKEVIRVSNQVNKIEISLKAMDEKIGVMLSKLNNMPIVQPKDTTSANTNSVEKEIIDSVIEAENCPQITDVQYNDAISEFERINNRLFKLRKYKIYSQELLRFLSTGEMDIEEYSKRLDESDLPEDAKEHLNTILYDIERYNTQRRGVISKYISQQKLISFDVRFPLLEGFDNKCDHHFKGDDVTDGEKIIRVCKLGYYFPNSHVAPYRVKCEVDTEKEE